MTRPHRRFVPIKEEHQQIILCLHRTWQGFVEERTATYNRLRGLIAEFGIVLPQKVACLRREIGAHREDLLDYANPCIGDRLAHAISSMHGSTHTTASSPRRHAPMHAVSGPPDGTSRYWPDQRQHRRQSPLGADHQGTPAAQKP